MQEVRANDVLIRRTRAEFRVEPTAAMPDPLRVEVRLPSDGGFHQRTYDVSPGNGFEESYGTDVDVTRCAIRVSRGDTLLAEMPAAGLESALPFMRLQGPQAHVTESSVAVPPALHITDAIGAVWTLGLVRALPDFSPRGEFAFPVLRDGVDTREIASRIEMRNGTIRIFTRLGWKKWNGRTF